MIFPIRYSAPLGRGNVDLIFSAGRPTSEDLRDLGEFVELCRAQIERAEKNEAVETREEASHE